MDTFPILSLLFILQSYASLLYWDPHLDKIHQIDNFLESSLWWEMVYNKTDFDILDINIDITEKWSEQSKYD